MYTSAYNVYLAYHTLQRSQYPQRNRNFQALTHIYINTDFPRGVSTEVAMLTRARCSYIYIYTKRKLILPSTICTYRCTYIYKGIRTREGKMELMSNIYGMCVMLNILPGKLLFWKIISCDTIYLYIIGDL